MIGVNDLTIIHKRPIETRIPLVVDIDGTLINSDLLFEALILLIKKNPVYLLKCFAWILKGKVYFKRQIFKRVALDYKTLPFNKKLLSFLQTEFSKGRTLVLATASPKSAAIEISKIFPIFTEIYGTEDHINLKGKNKLNVLISRFGEGKFDYVGNSRSDQIIFASSRYSYLVNPAKSVERRTNRISSLQHTWHSDKASIKDYIKEIRVYQWIKNLLLFVPVITSHSFYSLRLIGLTCLSFLVFSMVASAGYLFNDILDISSDRNHPRKRFRPVASGKIPILHALSLGFTFLTVGLFFAAELNIFFFYTLIFYFICSFSYSLFLKKMVLYDVFILAMLYSTRVFAGSLIIDVRLSFWLIAFSTFIFLSMAFLKRYSELISIKDGAVLKKQSRGYTFADSNLIEIMGIACGFLSIIVLALYINSPEVTILYSRPEILWAISFLLLFWIGRIWLLTAQGKMTDDPIIFALKDITSYIIFILCCILIVVAL
jgi:4-hydroxybenzoate polyprenyltransferase